MAATYTALATVEVGSGGAANIEFTSIPATYTDLAIVSSLRGENASVRVTLNITVNGSTANYSSRVLRAYDNTTVDSATGGSSAIDTFRIPAASNTASVYSNDFIYIPNYASSNNKSMSLDNTMETNLSSGTTNYLSLTAGLWSDSAAITSIKLASAAGNLAQHSSATLYGIKNS